MVSGGLILQSLLPAQTALAQFEPSRVEAGDAAGASPGLAAPWGSAFTGFLDWARTPEGARLLSSEDPELHSHLQGAGMEQAAGAFSALVPALSAGKSRRSLLGFARRLGGIGALTPRQRAALVRRLSEARRSGASDVVARLARLREQAASGQLSEGQVLLVLRQFGPLGMYGPAAQEEIDRIRQWAAEQRAGEIAAEARDLDPGSGDESREGPPGAASQPAAAGEAARLRKADEHKPRIRTLTRALGLLNANIMDRDHEPEIVLGIAAALHALIRDFRLDYTPQILAAARAGLYSSIGGTRRLARAALSSLAEPASPYAAPLREMIQEGLNSSEDERVLPALEALELLAGLGVEERSSELMRSVEKLFKNRTRRPLLVDALPALVDLLGEEHVPTLLDWAKSSLESADPGLRRRMGAALLPFARKLGPRHFSALWDLLAYGLENAHADTGLTKKLEQALGDFVQLFGDWCRPRMVAMHRLYERGRSSKEAAPVDTTEALLSLFAIHPPAEDESVEMAAPFVWDSLGADLVQKRGNRAALSSILRRGGAFGLEDHILLRSGEALFGHEAGAGEADGWFGEVARLIPGKREEVFALFERALRKGADDVRFDMAEDFAAVAEALGAEWAPKLLDLFEERFQNSEESHLLARRLGSVALSLGPRHVSRFWDIVARTFANKEEYASTWSGVAASLGARPSNLPL